MNGGMVSAAEVRKFDRLASRWWDPGGPMRPLHQMNPARIGWIDGLLAGPTRILDVGCGAGLAAEALARRGHDVLGIDAAGEAIEAAKVHAEAAYGEAARAEAALAEGTLAEGTLAEGTKAERTLAEGTLAQGTKAERTLAEGTHAENPRLRLAYRACTAEALVAENLRFPAIIALEVIEHVPDPAGFVRLLADLLEPGGVLVLSTLNRTRRSWIVGKLGAEYLLRLLPVGTHDWRAFITPAELAAMLRAAGLRVGRTCGLLADPLTGRWRIGRDMAVNYMMAAERGVL